MKLNEFKEKSDRVKNFIEKSLRSNLQFECEDAVALEFEIEIDDPTKFDPEEINVNITLKEQPYFTLQGFMRFLNDMGVSPTESSLRDTMTCEWLKESAQINIFLDANRLFDLIDHKS